MDTLGSLTSPLAYGYAYAVSRACRVPDALLPNGRPFPSEAYCLARVGLLVLSETSEGKWKVVLERYTNQFTQVVLVRGAGGLCLPLEWFVRGFLDLPPK